MTKLNLYPLEIAQARELAKAIVDPVHENALKHTTTTVERATLRLLGADGCNADGVPVPNLLVNTFHDRLDQGISRFYINALLRLHMSEEELNEQIAKGFDISELSLLDENLILQKGEEIVQKYAKRIEEHVKYRKNKKEQYKENIKDPQIYVIVATGNIYEDVKQAKAAAKQGADIIAVIRTTAQSLLDYVPFGATTEGFGGTYATQENFKIMRKAMDEVSEEERRYISVVNYCSGLCMPEIAAMGALERLDMMLNDSMYGILFRDINMHRTFVDQNFSRMINTYADIIINTGEDNYLTTSDAVEKAYTVLSSQLMNEQFALRSGMPKRLMGLGHAFEINPDIQNGFLYEVAHAQLAREVFPESPLKYMPPTKFMTGQVFKGYAMNTMFNFVTQFTNQSICLLGMLTEAIHTPYLQDRFLAIENAKYVMNTMKDFSNEIEFKQEGAIVRRAKSVLDESLAFLEEIHDIGLFKAISQGKFADVKRPEHGGKGADGVVKKAAEYWNPWESHLQKTLGIK